MKLRLQHQNWFAINQSYVPSRISSSLAIYLTVRTSILVAVVIITAGHHANAFDWPQNEVHRSIQPATSFLDSYAPYQEPAAAESSQFAYPTSSPGHVHVSNRPTPPLINAFSRGARSRHDENDDSSLDLVSNFDYPSQVSQRNVFRHIRAPNEQAAPDASLVSPVFEATPVEYTQEAPQQDASQLGSQSDANNMDIVEQGSGAGWPDVVIPFGGGGGGDGAGEDTNTLVDPSQVTGATPAGGLTTPIFEPMPNHPGGDNPPMLVRRLPKLVATSGSVWQYAVPPDTFQDEDGDLRQLKSSLALKQATADGRNKSHEASANFTLQPHWLQYDQNTQTFFGFPTDADIGRHEYLLRAYDRWNSGAEESVEIAVRPHQSSRAFTHSITMAIEWAAQRRTTMPEVLASLAKLISEGLFNDPNENNLVLYSYELADRPQERDSAGQPATRAAMSITWSNSSLPIHPCDLGGIESILRLLVDSHQQVSSSALMLMPGGRAGSELAPSAGLIRALSPDFKPSRVSVKLQAACDNRRSVAPEGGPSRNSGHAHTLDNTEPKVKSRIGKIRWKLGQPIVYRVPENVFTLADGTDTRAANLSLSLHTIDGKTLQQDPSYDFLEFDQDKRTMIGLPYDYTKHVGQRELLLTARNPATSQMAHETFVVDIEPEDLTTINNRAFRMSLYFLVRTNAFGPREKVSISSRMISALQLGEPNYDHEQERPDFTVIDIQRFTTSSNLATSSALNDPTNSWKYQDKIYLVPELEGPVTGRPKWSNEPSTTTTTTTTTTTSSSTSTSLYKFTWTNETIGYRGECPVEVIKENILYALERSMIDYVPANDLVVKALDDSAKNDSVRFYERLRSYFEPELDLIHLRFEPLGACMDALELHDVGNSDVADSIDKAGDIELSSEPAPTPHIRSTEVLTKPPKEITSPVNSDEYWAIVVLIILVVAIIFVVMMLFMGLHTYRINQEKRFELQLKLAQARQNSMYLSSMMLADHSYVGEMLSQQAALANKPAFVDERSSRKPVILDAEKQFLTNGHSNVALLKPTSVHLTGNSVQTLPLRQNTTFTMDSIANIQNSNNMPNNAPRPGATVANQQMFADASRQQSMTLNRRVVGAQARHMPRQGSIQNQLSQSQSILTVTSAGLHQPVAAYVSQPQAAVPFIYAPMPVFYESASEMPRAEL